MWTIYLTSSNESKTEALREVVEEWRSWYDDDICIKTSPLKENTPKLPTRANQPIGSQEGLECARLRIMETCDAALQDPRSIHVSIESTLEEDDTERVTVYDVALIQVYMPGQNLWSQGRSPKVRFPVKYWNILKSESRGPLGTITGGQLISEDDPNIPHNNWQEYFGGLSRYAQIKEGLQQALRHPANHIKALQTLQKGMRYFQDFPKPGIRFQDMNSLLEDRHLRLILCDAMERVAEGFEPTHIAGLDARGFILGGFLAERMDLPFIPLRKKGKLPGPVWSQDYGKEYGEDILELQKGAFKGALSRDSPSPDSPSPDSHPRVLIVDDILATGGTLGAALALFRQAEVEVAGMLVISDLEEYRETAHKRLREEMDKGFQIEEPRLVVLL